MIISFDSRAYILSIFRQYEIFSKLDKNNFLNFLGAGSGPQEFIVQLIHEMKKNRKINITFDFINSDIHLLNLGFHSPLWRNFQLKKKKDIIIRFDGIGIDNSLDPNLSKKNILDLVLKGNLIIFQSEFCKNFFKNEFGFLPRSKVILNGASAFKALEKRDRDFIKDKFSLDLQDEFFVIGGRYTKRKRIKEIIKSFVKANIYNLVVLSDVPKEERILNHKIKYLGKINPYLARGIIMNSKALIHMDMYDWCPNMVVSALADRVPVICSNFGGTKELVRKNGIIINEYPPELVENMDGINYVRNSPFPYHLLIKALEKNTFERIPENESSKYLMKECYLKYFDSFKSFIVNK